jgi:hypothetical protein
MLVAFVGIDPRTEESGQMKKCKSHTVAVLAVAGKLLRIIYSLVKSGKKYDPNYHYKLQNQEMRVHSNYTAKNIKKKKRNSNPNKQQPLLST